MHHGNRGGDGGAMNGTDGHPSPNNGDNTPSNDGERRNKERNKNYNGANNMNGGQPLPPNNGNNGGR